VKLEPLGWRGGGGIEARGLMRNGDRADGVVGVLGVACDVGGKEETDGVGEEGILGDRAKYGAVGVLGPVDGE
jgi:hypothetical protein